MKIDQSKLKIADRSKIILCPTAVKKKEFEVLILEIHLNHILAEKYEEERYTDAHNFPLGRRSELVEVRLPGLGQSSFWLLP